MVEHGVRSGERGDHSSLLLRSILIQRWRDRDGHYMRILVLMSEVIELL